MSWVKENYEKAALGGAAAVLIGVAATCFLGGGDPVSDKAKSFDEPQGPSTEALTELALVLDTRQVPAVVRDKSEKGREVNLFVGQRLYMTDGSTELVDLYESGPVHEGITNVWWRKYDIDPSFANAPERDHDKDGFTNREENVAQTNPTDASSYPALLSKVVGNTVDVFKMQIRWSVFDDKSVTLYYQDNKRARFNERVNFGATFFEKPNEAVKRRFMLEEGAVKAVDQRGREQDAYVIIDKTSRYKGTDREKVTLLRRGPFNGGFNEIQDRSVTLTLHALGKESESFVVREFEKFALPYDAKAKKCPYQVTAITPVEGQKDVFTVEIIGLIDGKKETRTLTVTKN